VAHIVRTTPPQHRLTHVLRVAPPQRRVAHITASRPTTASRTRSAVPK
jgi:hypothetical protein